MGIIFTGGRDILDKDSEDHIAFLAVDALKKNHDEELQLNFQKFRGIVFKQEVAKQKRFLETKHPEQVDAIFRLRGILNHERIK